MFIVLIRYSNKFGAAQSFRESVIFRLFFGLLGLGCSTEMKVLLVLIFSNWRNQYLSQAFIRITLVVALWYFQYKNIQKKTKKNQNKEN